MAKEFDAKLADIVDEDGIQREVSPDLKEAFLVNEEIIENNGLERAFIVPTITGGRDVKKYYATDIGRRLIYTRSATPEKQIEKIVEYVKKFTSLITCKEVEANKHPIWALHRAREKKIFDKPEKIVGVITGDKISLSIDGGRLYPTDGMYLFSSNGLYSNVFLVGLLNSKLLTYLYRLTSMEEGRTLAQIKPSILNDLPISRNFDKNVVLEIERLTNLIIEKIKDADASIDKLCFQIDQLVYKLYNLSDEQMEIVEDMYSAVKQNVTDIVPTTSEITS